MSTELVYRMRTCAAALVDGRAVPTTETVDLLIEASNLLDVPDVPADAPLGEIMEVLGAAGKEAYSGAAMWTSAGDLPSIEPRPCLSCGSLAARTVRRNGRRLMLTCPTCTHEWEYGR